MKTLSFETCKRLQEKWIWQEIQTEQMFSPKFWHLMSAKEQSYFWNIRAFNLEEALEILPLWYILDKAQSWYRCHNLWVWLKQVFGWEKPLIPVENMIIFLLDNNLLNEK